METNGRQTPERRAARAPAPPLLRCGACGHAFRALGDPAACPMCASREVTPL